MEPSTVTDGPGNTANAHLKKGDIVEVEIAGTWHPGTITWSGQWFVFVTFPNGSKQQMDRFSHSMRELI